ncbi:unnamed protein product [Paramecium sonneborni]|uniref:Uncharacterized protein n=1 Tax=Paramecium sonneborni TaxID=65129 RepID=A0A8S1Q583_9CILI|nr:unnamed protein product [Paramecium sonneborni]
MILEGFQFLLFVLHLLLGQLIPILMAVLAYVSKDKEKMSRWLIHFFLINVLKHTVFQVSSLFGFYALNDTLGICILILPMYISFETLENLVENIYNNIFRSKIEFLRQRTYEGLQKLNLL